MFSEKDFLKELKDVEKDAQENFIRRESEALINAWQLKVLEAARKREKSVDIFLGIFLPNKEHMDGAIAFFTNINFKFEISSKENPAKSNTHHYIKLEW